MRRLIPVALFLLVLSLVYHDALRATMEAWRQEEYSHGYLIPFVTIFLLLNLMPRIQTKPRASWLGFFFVVVCVVLQFLFVLAGVRGIQPVLLVVTLLSFFVLLYGLPFSRQAAGPLAFLFFLAPLPKFFYYNLSFKMQLASTELGTWLLQSLGISVFREGNLIDLGSTQLQVVEACNGLRYLFPLMALGYLLAYIYKASFVKRALLFLSTIPLTVVMNSLRLLLIGVTVDLWGPRMAEGLLHDVEGWFMFLGCVVVLLAEIAAMRRFGNKGEFAFDALSLPRGNDLKNLPMPGHETPLRAASVVFVLALVLQGMIVLSGWNDIKPVPLAQPLSEFPMQIGKWRGSLGSLNEKELSVLGTEDYLLADYTNDKNEKINLYILYYPKQDSTSNQGLHSPAVCIPAGGWTIEKKDVQTLDLGTNQSITVNQMVVSKGPQKQLVYYWFIQGNVTLWDVNFMKFVQAKNAVLRHRTDGAMIRVTMPFPNGDDSAHATAVLTSFIKENRGILPTALSTNDRPSWSRP